MDFKEWKQKQVAKSCTLEPGGLFTTKDLKEGEEMLDTAITDVSACSLNYWLHVEVHTRSKQLFWGTLSSPFLVLKYLRTEASPF